MKKYCFIFMFSVLGFCALSQEVPNFKKKTYRDSLNNLYWNKHNPVFVMLSETPNKTDAEVLESKEFKEYTEPFYFDTEGINYIRTNWAVDKETKQTVYPKVQVKWEVYADGLPPVTKLEIKSDSKFNEASKFFYGKATTIVLKSKDAVSGVEDIYYSINGEDYKKYTEPIILNADGENEFKYFAVDNVGNVEDVGKIKSKLFYVDVTPPVSKSIITGLSLGEENIISKSTKIYIEAKDDKSGIKNIFYRIDSMPEKKYLPKQTIIMDKYNDGEHTLYFYAVDNVGNKESMQTFKFYLDKTAPITVSDILGDKFIVGDEIYFSGRTKMKITSMDNKSGVKEVLYSIDNEKFKEYETPFYMPNTPGWHTVKYFATDNTDNVSKDEFTDAYMEYKMKIDRIFVDLTGPTIKHEIIGSRYIRNDTVYIGPYSKIKLSATDKESGLKHISYSIDGVLKETKYDKPFALDKYTTGEHEIEFFAYDNVNNRNIDKIKVILDNTGPNIDYKFSVVALKKNSNGVEIYPKGTDLFITVQDNITGISDIYYSLNGNDKKPYGKYISNLKKGTYNIEIEAFDKLKNKSTVSFKFKIK